MKLPSPPKLEPVKRLSPSTYSQIQQCALKGILQVNRVPPMLPVDPAARLGSVAHKVLEMANQGHIKDLEAAWDQSLQQVEDEMRSAGETFLLPLRESAQMYEVKKRITLNAAKKIITSIDHQVSNYVTDLQSIGAEIWLESADGLLGGLADRIVPTDQGVEIKDYKTGTVIEHETGEIKKAYDVQLLLYAVLYYEATGTWPVRLTISTLSGEEHNVPVDKERATQLMNEAREKLQELNIHIISGTPFEELAQPNSVACVFCSYRPACSAYWNNRSHDPKWPPDTKGSVHEVTQLGNRTLRAVIGDESGTITVRGIPAERFTFLQEEAKSVMFCNLKRESVEGVYKPSLKTTGYVLEK